MKTTKEIKEILSIIEQVLFEGMTDELDVVANRLYNVMVVPRDRMIETLQKERNEFKAEEEVTQEHLERFFLALGSKIADNEIIIKNPRKFIKVWKAGLITKND